MTIQNIKKLVCLLSEALKDEGSPTIKYSSQEDGIFISVKPGTEQAKRVLRIIEPLIHDCYTCEEKAVRVGMYPDRELNRVEYRGLCERHKNIGIWSNYNAAWGWN